MRELTQKEIDDKPEWSTHYAISIDDKVIYKDEARAWWKGMINPWSQNRLTVFDKLIPTKPVSLDGYVISTKDFNPNGDPKLLCTCGHDKCDKRSVKQWVLDRIQLVRNDYGPMTITSAGRCQYHPNEVHRVAPADHQKCIVVDVAYKTEQQRNQLMVLAGRYGATAVAGSDKLKFVHMAWREVVDQRVRTWVYQP